MLVHGDMLQKLVDKIISDIKCNINIIDTKGIIVASGEPDRIGTFHKVGLQAAENGCRIDIKKADESLYNGVKSGINLPFYYKKDIIGVIGITGNPKDISMLTNIVKSMIEIMYEQEILKQKMYYRQNSKVFFINELINLSSREDVASVEDWGIKLGYDMGVRRSSILIEFNEKGKKKSEFSNDEILQGFLKSIKKLKGHNKNDISTILSTNRIVVLKASYVKDGLKERRLIHDYISHVVKVLDKQTTLKYNISVGSFYDELISVKDSFTEAEFVLLQLQNSRNNNMGFINDYLMGYFSSRLPDGMVEHFFEDDYKRIKDYPDLTETIIALAVSNMHITLCAKELFLHRNTVLFRMNKLKEILQVDPVNIDSDRAYMMLFSEYLKLKTTNK